ncbi:Eco57I restriction-modification methylase domain-containing protein [Aliarcobacter cryaerophilus]|uniref:site-specific DNA-methyltransferase (adenine-specific) n=1 Tax=Aliarcobacter cryaerophilus TaxID=28198 RepID=A0A2S9TM12_9BACT|nr:N-6 DNA methylase [Aliarcobacter cryaerophilus]PRM99870.1 restriction endonuclease subunit M [Arcobacter cryaerophilus gv. pseudocryaerophilus]
MSMFQKSIINSVKQDETKVALRWASFQKFLEKVEYIKTVKEEKYQDGFLVDIFENCLGYTLDMTNPKSFNLEREKKNETDGKKADGVIYVNEKVVGVIELKGQDTKNLDKIETQAFNYHASHSNSKYIIISNFDELRFYVDKKTAYEKFNLFTLNYEEFKKLHLLISYESIKDDVPLKLKEKTNSFEQDISKKLYKDFSNFRTALFENIVKNNLGNEALASSVLNGEDLNQQTLLRLTQKLCDRIIFILFAEDRTLLRTNTIREIREEFINQKFTNYTLYDIYKFYFDAISNGNEKLDIPKYNGGLFATDELLDSLIIDDFILDENVQILSNYDFASEISVNILGHIFEQSLTDLEELQANIDNVNFDKTKSKRKKDGVFYTPEYITRYIVENTLGIMCSEKREELQIGNGILIPSNPKKLTKQEQQTKDNLQEYKNWLLNLKILDPACGSGAFLNQALEYLINEHKNLQNDLALMGDLFASYMVEEEILEHNLYGVDINEDAVEIAKLSLWLRTAKRGRALTKLADKIVCANSLLEMPFSENSFDVVIGNPPYVKEDTNKNAFKGLKESVYYQGKMDLWYFFGCQALDLIKENGLIGFIAPNNWISNAGASKFRNKVLGDGKILEFIDFGDFKVFEDAGIQTMIYIMTKSKDNLKYKVKISKNLNKNINSDEVLGFLNKNLNEKFDFFISNIEKNKMLNKIIGFSNQTKEALLDKVEKLKNFNIDGKNEIFSGIDFPQDFLNKKSKEVLGKNFNIGDGVFVLSKKEIDLIKLNNNEVSLIKPFYTTNELEKYWGDKENKFWTIYTNSSFKNPNSLDNYPNIKNHLDKFQEIITSENKPYGLNRAREENNFLGEKIIVKRKSPNSPCFTYVNFDCFFNRTFMIIKSKRINLKYLTSLLNSKLIAFWLKYKGKMQGDIFQVDKEPLLNLPILKIDEESQKPFIKLVDEILEAKQKIKDYKPLLDEAIKNNNFDREIALKKELENLENICSTNEKTIDQMVYKLYDLTLDEIKIVENR